MYPLGRYRSSAVRSNRNRLFEAMSVFGQPSAVPAAASTLKPWRAQVSTIRADLLLGRPEMRATTPRRRAPTRAQSIRDPQGTRPGGAGFRGPGTGSRRGATAGPGGGGVSANSIVDDGVVTREPPPHERTPESG